MYLLDTHTLLWFLRDDKKLSKNALDLITTNKFICVSSVSLWEIAIKNSIGKLDLDFSMQQIEQLCLEKNITILYIRGRHLDILKTLPSLHSDPFDRLIICQAIAENLTIITNDGKISLYPVKTIW